MMPEDYFKKLPDRMKENISQLEDDIKNDAPLLHKYGKRNPYTVPDNYFSNHFRQRNKNTPSRTIRLRQRITIAASLIVLMGLGLFIVYPNSETTDLAEVEVLDYYIENIAEVDEDFLLVLQEEYGAELEEESDTETDVYYEELINGLNDYELDNLF